jgi:hypothetical protein
MNTELQKERMSHELELSDACLACDGPIAVRITPGGARGVCRACRLVTTLRLAPAGEGVRVLHLPGGIA